MNDADVEYRVRRAARAFLDEVCEAVKGPDTTVPGVAEVNAQVERMTNSVMDAFKQAQGRPFTRSTQQQRSYEDWRAGFKRPDRMSQAEMQAAWAELLRKARGPL